MSHGALGDSLAFVNACLNGTCAVLLVSGRVAIARGKRDVHRRFMVTAFVVSTVFLASYLTRVALTGTHRDPHEGLRHAAYIAILGSHMVLAALVVPMVLTTLWLAYKARFVRHRRLAKITFPVWLYVSVTGVVVYVMLYAIP
jgi:putative membrane protein